MENDTVSVESTAASNNGGPKWLYKCLYCSKIFFTGRALGGHQNAHRVGPKPIPTPTHKKKRTHHLRIPNPAQQFHPGVPSPGEPVRSGDESLVRLGLGIGVVDGDEVGPRRKTELDLELKLYF